MFAAFRRLAHPTGVVVKVLSKYAFVRPDGATSGVQDVLVQSLVDELAGRDVDFVAGDKRDGKDPKAKDLKLCGPAESKGRIVRYNFLQGFGAVKSNDGTKNTIYHTQIKAFGEFIPKLKIDQRVEFDLRDDPKGNRPIATRVRRITP
eukprot:TRINITY_DN16420_c0_g1_i1.p2 TRINITY_DN16420_c0_g1~~TRINITY_DN16420_c0_g1_i1.p2  ORF type:complete len:155 (+),score=32.04 TRINITY_DN16420_c0_g1_i1:23-466(+)